LSINKKIAIGALWMMALRLIMKAISILSTFILVRLLSPADFGLMAMATSIVGLIELIRMFGFDMALIKNQNACEVEYNTAWTIGIIFSLVAATLTLLFSGSAAVYYQDERLADVLRVMALSFVINGFTNIGTVEFRKQFQFGHEFKFMLISKIIGFISTVSIAYYLRNYWALLIGTLIHNLAGLILSYIFQSYRPRIMLGAWKVMLSFSSWMMFNNVLTFALQNAQNFVLGRVAGSSVLGYYAISNEIGSTVHGELIAPINRAAYPGYSKLSGDQVALRKSYLDILKYIALISIPCGLGIAAVAPVFVPILLGNNWLLTIPMIQIIAIGSIPLALSSNASYIFMCLGKQYLNTFSLVIKILVLLSLLMYLANKFSGIGAALAFFVSTLFEFFLVFSFICKTLKIKIFHLVSSVYRPVLSSLIMFFSIMYLSNNDYLAHMSDVVLLVVLIIFGAIQYIFIVLFLCLPYVKTSCVEIDLLKKINRALLISF
jgi:lipopolysaccharide exporter